MMKFTILVIASVLAPGFAALIQTRPEAGVITLPHFFEPEIEIEAHPLPQVETVNACDACFEYMTTLIEQLTQVGVESPVHPELPEVALPESEPQVPEIGLPAPEVPVFPEVELPEFEIIRPLPESLPEDLRPLPVPEQPEIEINPIPIPVVPEQVVVPQTRPEVLVRPAF